MITNLSFEPVNSQVKNKLKTHLQNSFVEPNLEYHVRVISGLSPVTHKILLEFRYELVRYIWLAINE